MDIKENIPAKKTGIYLYQDNNHTQKIDIEEDTEISIVSIDSDIDYLYNIWEGKKLDLRVLMISKDRETSSHIDVILDKVGSKADVYILNFVISSHKTMIDGKIHIWQHGKDTQWHLLEENIILSDKAKIHTIPVLDVYNNQVSASHGAKITRFDKEKIFYLTSRWLDQEQSIQLLIKSYIDNIFFGKDDNKLEIIKNTIIYDILSSILDQNQI